MYIKRGLGESNMKIFWSNSEKDITLGLVRGEFTGNYIHNCLPLAIIRNSRAFCLEKKDDL